VAETVDRDENARLKSRFADVYAQYDRMRSGMGQLQQDLGSLEASAKSADGMVTAVVGARGQLVRLVLHEQAYQRHRPEPLARLITQTVATASASVAQEAQRMVQDFVPEDSSAGSFLRSADFTALMRRHDERMGYSPDQVDGDDRNRSGR
jgi:DNA-binding protein YbaB